MVSLCAVKRHLFVAAALSAPLAACIERPWQDTPAARTQIDRSALGDVLVSAPPPDLVPVGAVFGNAVELIGYKLEPPTLVPGQRTRLTFYWRCRAELEAWHIFVHLDDANGTGERIHGDHDPAQGRYPTDAWRPGDIIADPIVFAPGRSPLLVFLGFYTQGDNRLPLTATGLGRDDGSSRLLAGTLQLAR
jgi:hypothetical protein